MMLAIEQKRGRKGGHKLRPLNPQNLRLWDAMFGRGSEFGNLEPTYSANQAPLVVRARTLQRRLRAVLPDLTLRETNVPFLLRPNWKSAKSSSNIWMAEPATGRHALNGLTKATTSPCFCSASRQAGTA